MKKIIALLAVVFFTGCIEFQSKPTSVETGDLSNQIKLLNDKMVGAYGVVELGRQRSYVEEKLDMTLKRNVIRLIYSKKVQ